MITIFFKCTELHIFVFYAENVQEPGAESAAGV